MKLLFVTASLFGEASKSRQIASEFIAAWQAAHPGVEIAERVLSGTVPHLSQAAVTGFMTPPEQRSPAQRDAVALSDELIAEIEAAATVVIAAPMYNFSIPSTLKAWIDHITRAGRTFRYSAAGSEGMLKSKKVYIVTARGGLYSGDGAQKAMDFQEPYLRAMLGFLGLTDVTFIHREGLAIGPEAAAAGLERARKAIGELVPVRAAA